jgi:hypothetical protein
MRAAAKSVCHLAYACNCVLPKLAQLNLLFVLPLSLIYLFPSSYHPPTSGGVHACMQLLLPNPAQAKLPSAFLPLISPPHTYPQVACTPAQRGELRDLVQIFRMAVIDVSRTTMTLEVQGREDKMSAVADLLEPYGEGRLPGVDVQIKSVRLSARGG